METIVLIPIYKTDLNEAEIISLRQTFKVFSNESICYVAPQEFVMDEKIPCAEIERYHNEYFRDVYGYSELLTSAEFYQRFLAYDYVLIVQLDAFVFSNRLKEFCELGYDYYGARIPELIWPYLKHRIGNGGFSLRKVSSCLRMCIKKKEILNHAKDILNKENYKEVSQVEDQFFSFCGNEYPDDYKLASDSIAEQFSIEFNVDGIYRQLPYHLPFGCHRWYQSNISMWWQYIKKYGYSLSDDFFDIWEDRIPQYEYQMFFLYKFAENNKYKYRSALGEMVGDKQLVIWGNGSRGKKMRHILDVIGYDNYLIIDKGFTSCMPRHYTGIEEINHTDLFIIITPEKQVDIQHELKNKGMKKNRDYILFEALLKKFLLIL